MKLIKETRIVDEFVGFDDEMIFLLDSGEKYQQSMYKYKYHYAYRPKVKVFSDSGKYFLDIVGMGELIEVRRIF